MSSPPPVARRRGRPKAGEAVDAGAILDAALRAFARHGFDGVSVATLNRELGVSHNLIHQRFGSKAELWRAAVDHGFGRMVRHMEGVFDPTISDPLEQLRLAIRSFIVFSAEHPELLALMDIEARQDTDRLAYIYETYMAPMYGGIGRLTSRRSLALGQRSNSAPTCVLVPLAGRIQVLAQVPGAVSAMD